METHARKGKRILQMPRRASLFWDTDPKKIHPKKHAIYIIERILDFGTDQEVRWLLKTYSKPTIRRVVKTSRVLQPKTRTLWKVFTKM